MIYHPLRGNEWSSRRVVSLNALLLFLSPQIQFSILLHITQIGKLSFCREIHRQRDRLDTLQEGSVLGRLG